MRKKTQRAAIAFLVSRADYEKIEGLIQALGLAVAEIIGNKQVTEKAYPAQKSQWDYDERVNSIVDTGDLY